MSAIDNNMGMLVIGVSDDEVIYLNDLVRIRVYKDRGRIRMKIEAPKDVIIKRVKDKPK